jgi:hypothetical protein
MVVECPTIPNRPLTHAPGKAMRCHVNYPPIKIQDRDVTPGVTPSDSAQDLQSNMVWLLVAIEWVSLVLLIVVAERGVARRASRNRPRTESI